jgi:L-lactate utilization protein LutB
LKENRISKDDVYAVAVPCQDTLDGGEPCDNCKNKKPVSCDESIGFDEEKLMGESKRMKEVEKLEKMTADERNAFWKNEFSRCIRCNACRNVCPACTCEKCVFDNNALYTSQKVAVTSFEESLFHIIRAWHVAGRCTDCGECSRVCPQGIPLHLLNRKFIKDINSIYGEYQAGADMESKPVMWTFKEDDPETSIITDRQEGGND